MGRPERRRSKLVDSYPSIARGAADALGDFPLLPKLKLQLVNELGQALACEGINLLQSQSPGLRQLPSEFFAVDGGHLVLLPRRRRNL